MLTFFVSNLEGLCNPLNLPGHRQTQGSTALHPRCALAQAEEEKEEDALACTLSINKSQEAVTGQNRCGRRRPWRARTTSGRAASSTACL